MSAPKDTPKAHVVVADRIRQRIVNGDLPLGERLPPEDDLTEQLGVARTTLREALRVLESQGLIVVRRGRGGGPVVTHPDLEPISMALGVVLQLQGTTIGDLDAARQIIEPQIAGQLAATRPTPDLSELEAAIDVAPEAADAGDGNAFGLAAAGVHDALVSCSGNVTLSTITHLLQGMLRQYYRYNMDTVEQAMMQRAVRGYRKLVQLIRFGDSPGATAHWAATMQYTLRERDPNEPVTIASAS